MTVQELLQLIDLYNKRHYPDQLLGVICTFSIFPDGSGWLMHYLTETILFEFNNPEELTKFLKEDEEL